MRLLLALLFTVCNAYAQYPTKPVRVVIGYAAGSSTDIVGRVIADRLAAYWHQNVYVETRAGAAGNLAADAVAKAAGDGYTLLFAQNGLAISAAALPNLPFKAEHCVDDAWVHVHEINSRFHDIYRLQPSRRINN